MNLFEKMFNYQIMSQLHDSGISTLTSQERSWLKSMMALPAARMIFSPSTYDKLLNILDSEETINMSNAITEKARSQEIQLIHPHIRALRQYIAKKSAIQLTTRLKDGQIKEREPAFPYKLEFSMVKRKWYLLWYHLRHKALLSTKLSMIESFNEMPSALPPVKIEWAQNEISKLLDNQKRTATIEIIRLYNQELSRILYAFSCFEKEVEFDESSHRYLIKLFYQGNDGEYILSKVRFLGQRVKIIEGDHLRRRMLESATKALARYGETNKS